MKKLMALALPVVLAAMVGCGNDSLLNPQVGGNGNTIGTEDGETAEGRVKPPKDTVTMHNIADEIHNQGGEIRDDGTQRRGAIKPIADDRDAAFTPDKPVKTPKDKVSQN